MNTRKPFLSDNAATVHPKLWEAMKAADSADLPYDEDCLSKSMDERFSEIFGRECSAMWIATGTAANCLALATMVDPHGGVVCHQEAHIEVDEGGAPGFYLHGAKLILASGKNAKLTPADVSAAISPIRHDVHQVQAQAISITQASEYGCSYRLEELSALGNFAEQKGLGLHMDGARFANAVDFLGGSPADAVGPCDSLALGFIKNGGMNAEALVMFDLTKADLVKYRRKRAGHLQCKGRYLAAQILAMLENNLWLSNARSANSAAQEVAAACSDRLLHPVEANELFVHLNEAERKNLRDQGFEFYDWGETAARFVTAWNTRQDHALSLAKALKSL
jgi:threonine aldolase